MSDIVFAINNLAQPRWFDYLTLLVSVASLYVAYTATIVAKEQKAISIREEQNRIQNERKRIIDDMFDILHILKHYNGENLDASVLDLNFKKLQKMRLITTRLFSNDVTEFITEILTIVHEMPTKRKLKTDGVPDGFLMMLKNSGVSLNIEDLNEKNLKRYSEDRYFLSKDAFDKFEELFTAYV